jgi:hypothetical protein
MTDEEQQLTLEEQQMLKEALASSATQAITSAEEKHNVHTFLNMVANAPDTTKLGNLTEDEVGFVKFPLRTIKDCALISERICDDEIMTKFFIGEAENITAPSLSKDAKLVTLAVIQKREIKDTTDRKKNMASRGWFKGRDKQQEQQE